MREIRGDWRDIFHTFRMALDLRKLSLAFVGSVFSFLGIGFILLAALLAYHHKAGRQGLWNEIREGRWDVVSRRVSTFADQAFARAEAPGRAACTACRAGSAWTCPVGGKACASCRPSRILAMVTPSGLARLLHLPSDRGGLVLYLLCGLWLLFVWAFFGGAITRIAAVELAKDERIAFSEATRFAWARRWSYLWSPLSVGAAALVFALAVLGGAWVCDTTWNWLGLGKLLLVLGLPLALLGGFLILLLGIGGVLGCGLMFPAVSAEGTDAFDAVSRAFSYVFSKPWRYLGYHLAACLYAIPSVLFVVLFAFGFVHLTLALARCGMPHAAEPGGFGAVLASLPPALGGSLAPIYGTSLSLTGILVAGMLYLVLGMAFAYVVSYHWTAKTIVYFLLRRAVDGTEMKEVYEEESEEDLVAAGSTPPASPAAPPKA